MDIAPDYLLLLLPPTVIATAILSGTFGMGGGLILIAVLGNLLPVPEAMVLHGATQLTSNGSRAWFLRRSIRWRIAGLYCIGAAAGVAVCWSLGIVVDRRTLMIALGVLPLLAAVLRTPAWFTITRGPLAVLCGAVVTSAQVIAGVSGPLLDVFYVKAVRTEETPEDAETLDRRQVIGTKALTQCLGHAVKLVYFIPHADVAGPGSAVSGTSLVVAALSAVAGTWVGKRLLERLSDGGFRRWSTVLITALSAVLLARGISM